MLKCKVVDNRVEFTRESIALPTKVSPCDPVDFSFLMMDKLVQSLILDAYVKHSRYKINEIYMKRINSAIWIIYTNGRASARLLVYNKDSSEQDWNVCARRYLGTEGTLYAFEGNYVIRPIVNLGQPKLTFDAKTIFGTLFAPIRSLI